jgi:hypothetical protein
VWRPRSSPASGTDGRSANAALDFSFRVPVMPPFPRVGERVLKASGLRNRAMGGEDSGGGSRALVDFRAHRTTDAVLRRLRAKHHPRLRNRGWRRRLDV